MGAEGLIQNAVWVAVLCLASAAAWQALLRTSPIHPLPVHLLPRPPAEGVYAPNFRLNNAVKVGSGLIPGGEDLAVDREGRSFFTGCSDGWIKRVWIDQPDAERVENWTFVGGRPLGLALGPMDELIVCAGDRVLLLPLLHIFSIKSSITVVLFFEVDCGTFFVFDFRGCSTLPETKWRCCAPRRVACLSSMLYHINPKPHEFLSPSSCIIFLFDRFQFMDMFL
jgi:hypothetical protein